MSKIFTEIKNISDYQNSFNKFKAIIQPSTKFQNIYQHNIARCRLYSAATKSYNKFLIVPSIINDTSIFDIPEKSFINFLQQYGDVYVIEWLDITANTKHFDLNNYILETIAIIKTVLSKQRFNIIGYCLGGNFAIAISILLSKQIKSLMLIATPWNFSYAIHQICYLEYLGLDNLVKSLDTVPAAYIQLLFFLMDSEQTLAKFLGNNNVSNATEFFMIERWLYSSKNMTHAAYKQITNDFIKNNMSYHNKWYIANQCINPTIITVPVLTLLGTRDKIVAPAAVRALYSIIPNTYNIEAAVGHIGFFIGRQQKQIFAEIKQWIEQKL